MPTARKFSDEDKIEMVKMLISGATQRAVSTKFNYAQSSINKLYSKAKAMIKDFATNHSIDETVKHFKKWGISEIWLSENDIICTPPVKELNKMALVRNYQMGVNIVECADIYDISEEEVRDVLNEYSVIIREGAETVDVYDLPQLHTYDIVFVKNGKYGVDRNPNIKCVSRPAIVLTPNDVLNNYEKNRAKGNITVIYGTANIYADNKYNLVVDKYYTGKKTQFELNRFDTIHYTDICVPRNNCFSYLNDKDVERLQEKLLSYFCDDIEIHDENEEEEIEVVEPVKKLFENGFDRMEIYDFFKSANIDVSKAEIQSILDTNGFGGVKAIPKTVSVIEDTPEPKVLTLDPTNADYEKQIAVLEAKISVYEKIYDKSNVSVNI